LNQSDNAAPRRPRSGPHRDVDRRPYPTAPTPTRPSFARSGTARASARSRRPDSAPIPATVWVAGSTPIDPEATWPPSIVAAIVSSFSEPGARVALLPWPAATIEPGSTNRDTDLRESAEVNGALIVIDDLGRHGQVLQVSPTGVGTVMDSHPTCLGQVDAASGIASPQAACGAGVSAPGPADLIIVHAPPRRVTEGRAGLGVGRVVDQVALVAATALRVGGIFVVLTHCDWAGGELKDPGGLVVAAGQCADLLYLQHIVALHLPVRAGRFSHDADLSQDVGESPPEHRAAPGQSIPGVHRRIHSDVYVFAQPHDHTPLPDLDTAPVPLDSATQNHGVIR
jgi:hypothetical protein